MSNSFGQYRNSKQFSSDSETESGDSEKKYTMRSAYASAHTTNKMSFDVKQIRALIKALQEQEPTQGN